MSRKLSYSQQSKLNPITDKRAADQGYEYGQGLLNAYQQAQPGLVQQNTQLLTSALPQISQAVNAADRQTRNQQLSFLRQQQDPGIPAGLAQQGQFLTQGRAGTGPLAGLLNSQAMNAGPSAISQQLEAQALQELRLGGALSTDQERMADQSARGAWADRGLLFSNPALVSEVLNRDAVSQARLRERQQFAGGVNQQLLAEQQANRGFQGDAQRLGLARDQLYGAQANDLNRLRLAADPARSVFGAQSNAPQIAGGLLGQSQQTGLANMGLQDAYSGFLMNRTQANQIGELNRLAGVQSGKISGDAAGDAADAATTGAVIAGVALVAAAFICWVAREVYGEHDPRWRMFRYWLIGQPSLRLLRRYMARGPQIAKWLSTRPKYKRRVRRWMNRCIAEVPEYARLFCEHQHYALAA